MATVVEVVQPTGTDFVEVAVPGTQGPKGDPGDIAPSSVQTASGVYSLLAGDIRTTKVITLSGDLIINTLPTISSSISGIISLNLKQPSSGGPFNVTFPSGIRWTGGAPAPLMPTPVSSMLAVHLFWNGIEWLGVVMGTYV